MLCANTALLSFGLFPNLQRDVASPRNRGFFSIVGMCKVVMEVRKVKVEKMSECLDDMGRELLAKCEGSYAQCSTSTCVLSYSSEVVETPAHFTANEGDCTGKSEDGRG